MELKEGKLYTVRDDDSVHYVHIDWVGRYCHGKIRTKSGGWNKGIWTLKGEFLRPAIIGPHNLDLTAEYAPEVPDNVRPLKPVERTAATFKGGYDFGKSVDENKSRANKLKLDRTHSNNRVKSSYNLRSKK